MKLDTIVLTTDFSELSMQAFEPAVTLAERFGAKVLLTHVGEDRIPPLYGDFAGGQIQTILDSHREHATRELERLAREHLASQVEVEPIFAMGIPHRKIVELAEDRGADLIVMATHGRGFVAHAILGSNTERVIRHAPCPVLAIRAAGAK